MIAHIRNRIRAQAAPNFGWYRLVSEGHEIVNTRFSAFSARTLVLATVLIGSSLTAAYADDALAPSKVVAQASTYDQQTISVAGTVKNVTTGSSPRGNYTKYDLCDSQCITIVQFGSANVKEGQQQTVTGTFRANAKRMHLSNVLVIH
jgi:cytochrome c-type biogenesis protein CcmE